tara:strand:- start:1774 stop:2694 length:921 start_codon:yes stop_codon:yes gene_type:complete
MAQPTVSSSFAGTAAGFYISAALKQANSLDYITLMENVKFKQAIQRIEGASLITEAGCDFVPAGTLAMTEKSIEPKNLMINLDICKSQLLSSWESLQMKAGSGAATPPAFNDYVISHIGEIIAAQTENNLWNGTGAGGTFNGFVGATTGWLLPAVDGTVVQSTASAAYSAANIVANLQTLVADILGGTAANILGKDDCYIYMNNKTYQFYVSAMSALNYINMSQMNDTYQPYFEGIKIAVVNGMVDNELVFAETSNLYAATDLISDSTRIDILDMAKLDASDNMRLVARYSMGTQTGVGADIVRQS